MIPLYPVQMLSRIAQWIEGDRTPTTSFYYLIYDIWQRTGGQSGIPSTASAGLAAAGVGQSDALALSDDFNEVLTGSGGVVLAALQPGQFQVVFNGLGGNLNVYPAGVGTIDGNTSPYVLASTKTQIFWCASLLASGGPVCHSVQLG